MVTQIKTLIRKFARKLKGLTLLEMILSIGIFVLVATAISVIFRSSLDVYRESTDKNEAAQQAALAAEWLVRDIRESAYAIKAAEANNIALVTQNGNYIRYYLDGDQTIKRQNCTTGAGDLLAEDVAQFSLKYYDISNTEFSFPIADQDLPSIVAVEIDITTERNDEEFQLNTVAVFEYNPDYSWAKAYGGSIADELHSLQQTLDPTTGDPDGYILGGKGNFAVGGDDFLVIRTDPDGDVGAVYSGSWAYLYGGSGADEFRSLEQTDDDGDSVKDDGYILGGRGNFAVGGDDFLAIKTAPDGSIIGASEWAKLYGSSINADELHSLQQTSDGGYILGGRGNFAVGGDDFLVIKIAPDGTIGASEWANLYGSSINADELRSLQQTSDGGYILGGRGNFAVGGDDFLAIRTDADGNIGASEWANLYGGTSADELHSLEQTDDDGDGEEDDGYILGGRGNFAVGGDDFLVIKVAPDGSIGASEWANLYGGSNVDELRSLQQTSDGGYILGGTTASFGAGGNDFLVIKIDAEGSLLICCAPVTVTDATTQAGWHVADATTQAGWHVTDATAQAGEWHAPDATAQAGEWHVPADATAQGAWHAPADATGQGGWGVASVCPSPS